MIVTICGGGSTGHVCLGVLASQKELVVNVLTGKPSHWQRNITVTDIEGKVYNGPIHAVTDNPAEVIPNSDIVLLCLPGFAIEEELRKIKPFLNNETAVGSIVCSTGFFFFAHKVLGTQARLFGFQRVPYIARTVEYGSKANLLGYKKSLNVALENIADAESFRNIISKMFLTHVELLGSFYEASLTNSNPILHTGRLYSMWHQWEGETYDRCTLFYYEWTEDAAQWLINMDAEFMQLLEVLPMNKAAVPSLLDYYESTDAATLSAKLKSIEAFKNILAPMKEITPGKWVPDFESRYFTEDFPYGLKFIHDLAHENNISCPCIDTVFEWGMKMIRQA